MKTSVTFDIDTDALDGYTDDHLASLWHVAQANPAPISNKDASQLAGAIGFEIVKRWLKDVPAPLYHHQQSHHYWSLLQVHGRMSDGGSKWVPHPNLEGGAK